MNAHAPDHPHLADAAVARRAAGGAHACDAPNGSAAAQQALDRYDSARRPAASSRRQAAVARPDLDEVDARERRRAVRLGEARPAARLVLAARAWAAPHSSSRPTGAAWRAWRPSMLSEGTATRDGEALSNALQLLGTTVGAAWRPERFASGFVSTTGQVRRRRSTCLADMLLNSDLPGRRARAAPRAAAGRADAGEGAAGRDCRTGLPAGALRTRPTRTGQHGHRGVAQGHHARRRRRVRTRRTSSRGGAVIIVTGDVTAAR